MAKRIKTEGNYVIVEDTVTSAIEISEPNSRIRYKEAGSDSITFLKLEAAPHGFCEFPTNEYALADLVNGDDSDAAFGTFTALLTYLRTVTGFKRGGGNGQGVASDEFIIRVKTDNPGVTTSTQMRIPVLTGTWDVDWGDGTIETGLTGTQTHTYASAGEYDIKILGATWIRWFNGNDDTKVIELKNWGIGAWTNMQKMFQGCSNMLVTATDIPDLSATTTLNSVFQSCSGIIDIPNIGQWDVSGIENFSSFITGCSSIVSLDLSGWVTTAAENFSYFAAACTSLTSLGDLSGWDMVGVTTISDIFQSCTVLVPTGIGSWDTSTILDMGNALFNCDAFDEDISGWTVTQVTDFVQFMLGSLGMSTANYDALLIAWDAQGAMSFSGTHNFGTSTYTSGGAAETARTSLISKWGAITDGGAA